MFHHTTYSAVQVCTSHRRANHFSREQNRLFDVSFKTCAFKITLILTLRQSEIKMISETKVNGLDHRAGDQYIT